MKAPDSVQAQGPIDDCAKLWHPNNFSFPWLLSLKGVCHCERLLRDLLRIMYFLWVYARL